MLAELLQPFLSVLYAHPYLFIFIGMIFMGEVVLLPAIYLAVTGRLELAYVIFIAIAATLLSDLFWFYLGRRFPASALDRIPGRHTGRLVDGLERLFDKNGAHVIFLSKFVYGTRTVAQVLAGIHDMPTRTYLVANTLGVAALTLVLSGIAWSVAGTARRFEDAVHSAEIAFVAFVIIAAAGYWFAAALARRKWSR